MMQRIVLLFLIFILIFTSADETKGTLKIENGPVKSDTVTQTINITQDMKSWIATHFDPKVKGEYLSVSELEDQKGRYFINILSGDGKVLRRMMKSSAEAKKILSKINDGGLLINYIDKITIEHSGGIKNSSANNISNINQNIEYTKGTKQTTGTTTTKQPGTLQYQSTAYRERVANDTTNKDNENSPRQSRRSGIRIPQLGLELITTEEALPDGRTLRGSKIVAVQEDGPAYSMGLQPGDLIVSAIHSSAGDPHSIVQYISNYHPETIHFDTVLHSELTMAWKTEFFTMVRKSSFTLGVEKPGKGRWITKAPIPATEALRTDYAARDNILKERLAIKSAGKEKEPTTSKQIVKAETPSFDSNIKEPGRKNNIDVNNKILEVKNNTLQNRHNTNEPKSKSLENETEVEINNKKTKRVHVNGDHWTLTTDNDNWCGINVHFNLTYNVSHEDRLNVLEGSFERFIKWHVYPILEQQCEKVDYIIITNYKTGNPSAWDSLSYKVNEDRARRYRKYAMKRGIPETQYYPRFTERIFIEENRLSQKLIDAARDGEISKVKSLLKQAVKINVQGKDKITALMIASEKGRIKVVRFLLENGAKINLENTFGKTALMLATEKGHKKIIKLLNAQLKKNIANKSSVNSIIDGYWSKTYMDTTSGRYLHDIFQIKTTRIEGNIVYFEGTVVFDGNDQYNNRSEGFRLIKDGKLNVETGQLSYFTHIIFHDYYGQKCFPDGNWYKRTGRIASDYTGERSSDYTKILYDTYEKHEWEKWKNCELIGVGFPITDFYIRRYDYDSVNGDLIDIGESVKIPELVNSAEAGDADAQFNLGIMYRNGYGVKKNHDKAGKWFYKAAEQGHVRAKEILKQDKNFENFFDTVGGFLND